MYGFDIETKGDAYVAGIERVLAGLEAFTPGKYLVDVLPVLRFVPSWVPGAGFQKTFATARQFTSQVMQALCARTKEGMVCFSCSGYRCVRLIDSGFLIGQRRGVTLRSGGPLGAFKGV